MARELYLKKEKKNEEALSCLGMISKIQCKVTKQSTEVCGLHSTICEQKREKEYFIKIHVLHTLAFPWLDYLWKDTQASVEVVRFGKGTFHYRYP